MILHIQHLYKKHGLDTEIEEVQHALKRALSATCKDMLICPCLSAVCNNGSNCQSIKLFHLFSYPAI